jgi:hypothetical protein
MIMKLLCAALFFSTLVLPAFAQTSVEATPTPVEVVVTDSMPAVQTAQKVRPRVAPTPTPIIVGTVEKMSGPAAVDESTNNDFTGYATKRFHFFRPAREQFHEHTQFRSDEEQDRRS